MDSHFSRAFQPPTVLTGMKGSKDFFFLGQDREIFDLPFFLIAIEGSWTCLGKRGWFDRGETKE